MLDNYHFATKCGFGEVSFSVVKRHGIYYLIMFGEHVHKHNWFTFGAASDRAITISLVKEGMPVEDNKLMATYIRHMFTQIQQELQRQQSSIHSVADLEKKLTIWIHHFQESYTFDRQEAA